MWDFILEFPNLSRHHLDRRDRDNNLHNKMKDVERVSFPVQNTPEWIFTHLCSFQRHVTAPPAVWFNPNLSELLTCVYVLQAVAAEVEQL